jgi:hypothetical protein
MSLLRRQEPVGESGSNIDATAAQAPAYAGATERASPAYAGATKRAPPAYAGATTYRQILLNVDPHHSTFTVKASTTSRQSPPGKQMLPSTLIESSASRWPGRSISVGSIRV